MSSRLFSAAAWLAAMLFGLLWITTSITVRSDLTSFMPAGASPDQRLLLSEIRSGPASRVILAAIPLRPGDSPGQQSASVVRRLRDSGLFTQVANGQNLFVDQEREFLFSHRYLLSPGVSGERFSTDGLAGSFKQRLRELKSALPALDKRRLASDPTAEMAAILRAWRPPSQPTMKEGVWTTRDGSSAVVLLQTRAPGFDLDAQEHAVQAVNDAVAVAGSGSAGEHAREPRLSGPGVFAVSSRETIRSDSRRLGVVASVVVVLILLVSYRSASVLFLAGLPLAFGVLSAIIAVHLLFDGIHGITIAFGATIIGVVVDYPIHLFSHLRGTGTVTERVSRIWPTLRLSALTTATGYFAMTGANFPGLQELATFAIAGLIGAAACTRWGVPAFLPGVPRLSSRPLSGSTSVRMPGSGGRAVALCVLSVAGLAAVTVLVLRPPAAEDDISALSPIPPSVFARDAALRAQLGIPDVNHVAVVRGADAQAVLEASEAFAGSLSPLVDEGIIGSFDHAARYLPSVRTQEARRSALPERAELRERIALVLGNLPFRASGFTPFLDAVEMARTQPALRPQDLEGMSIGVKVRSTLFPGEDGWSALVSFAQVRAPAELEQRIRRLGRPDVSYLNVKRDTSELMGDFRRHALERMAAGLLIMAAVLWIGLGAIGRGLLAMLPGVIAIVFTLAILSLADQRLTLFHLMSLLLVLGISIDYSLFFSRRDPDQETRAQTLHGLLVCVVSTVSVFTMLATSNLPILRAIGMTVAVGAATSFLTAWFLSGSSRLRGGPSRPGDAESNIVR